MSDATAPRASQVFISYRRHDAAGHAGRLYDLLTQRLAGTRVFMDIDAIPLGVDFAKAVRDALDDCQSVLALIGKGWLDARDRDGRRRLDLPDDYVRVELEIALERGIPILPVLVQGAEMPTVEDLPRSLETFARLNALDLTDRGWRRDVELLFETLAAIVARPVEPHPTPTPTPVATDDGDDARPHTVSTSDVRKLVSVVFAGLAERRHAGPPADPEAIEFVRRRFFDGARTAIQGHGGGVERFVGDAIVGVFGVPTAHEDDALRATRAAWDLLALAPARGTPGDAGIEHRLELRVAVATGETVVRSDPSGGLTAGDIVGSAARIQHDAQPDEVLLERATYELVQTEVEASVLIGEGGADDRFRLERVRGVGEPAIPRRTAPFVGRDRELANVAQLLEDCIADDACALVTLLGEAGIGKTRVVNELQDHLGAAARVVVGTCASYGEGVTFLPVAQIVAALAGLDGAEDPSVIRRRLEATVERFRLPPVAAAGLARVVGIEPPAGEIEETFWAFRTMLEGFAKEHPLVVVFEDLHWAHESVLDIVEHVADWSTEAPMLIVATARPDLMDRRPEWAGGKRQATTRTLKPLRYESAKALMESLPEGATLPDAVADRLLDAAGGVPLFLEEVVAAVVERRASQPSAATADVASEILMPRTLSALLEARIDQLPRVERTVLQRASIVGDSVALEPLRALTGLGVGELTAAIERLVRREILDITEGDVRHPTRVRCRHALLREAAYQSLTKGERAALHEAFVAWLDGSDVGLLPSEREALVGRQLERAINASRQIFREPPAHSIARATTAFATIIDDANGLGRAPNELLARVRKLAEREPSMRVALGPTLASALADNGDCDAAAEIISEWSTADATGVRWRLADAALRTARLSKGDHEAATAILDRLAAHDPPLAPADEIEALFHRGFLASQFGKRAGAVDDFTRAAEIARAESFRHHEIRALRHLITSATYGPTPVDEVEGIVERASTRMEELGSRPATLARVTALLAAMRGDDDAARVALRRYFDLEQAYGLSRYFADQGQDVYDVEWWAGDLDAARVALEASDKQLTLMGADNYRTTVLAQLARVLARQGRAEEALSAASEAERIVEPYDSDSLVLLHSAYADAYGRLGRSDEAMEAARVAVAVETDCLLDRGEAWLSYAAAFGRAGHTDDALGAVRESLDCFERKRAASPIRRARAALDALTETGSWPRD